MSKTFDALGVPEHIARAMAERGITEPFAIQAATIPDALAGRDICGKAPTGSGKTIAFGVPMIARIDRAAPKRPKGLVLTPTRELALQVADELRQLGDLRVLAVYGGAGIEPQLKALRRGVDVVVACPGRLLDVIERKACDLRDVQVAVVDEADRMADMGFLPDVRRILAMTDPSRQTLLFSATLDGAIDALVSEHQVDPVVHEVPEEKAGDISHHLWLAERPARAQVTADVVGRCGPTVVFSRTRHGADRIARQLEKLGVSAAAIHGSRSQAQRERALRAFHRGEVQALVATDVAARGIHVEGVTCVVHFDIPADHKDYIHRSGRTGRAGSDGTVVALLSTAQKRDAAKLARQAGIDVGITDPDVQALPEGNHTAPAPKRSRRSEGSRRTDGSRRTAGSAHRGSERRGRPARDATSAGPAPSEGGGPNRAERRAARFGPPDSPERRARAEAKARSKGGSKGGSKAGSKAGSKGGSKAGSKAGSKGGSKGSARAEGSQGDQLDRHLAGSGKVRPSGASRRKAKREAMLAAGISPPTGGKKRRR